MAEVDPRDARIAELEEQLKAALARIAELEARLGLNSRNSNKPPSSDGPGVVRGTKPATGRKPGGQKGHKGYKRELPEKVSKDSNPRLAPYESSDTLTGRDIRALGTALAGSEAGPGTGIPSRRGAESGAATAHHALPLSSRQGGQGSSVPQAHCTAPCIGAAHALALSQRPSSPPLHQPAPQQGPHSAYALLKYVIDPSSRGTVSKLWLDSPLREGNTHPTWQWLRFTAGSWFRALSSSLFLVVRLAPRFPALRMSMSIPASCSSSRRHRTVRSPTRGSP
jgi:hypothetical protein